MTTTYRSAMGKTVNMDLMMLANEKAIAVGNMNVNARGDELQGGKIVKTKAQVMQEYYSLNVPVADDTPLQSSKAPTILPDPIINPMDQVVLPTTKQLDGELDGGVDAPYVKPRGSLADSVSQETEVSQTLITPPGKTVGVKRI